MRRPPTVMLPWFSRPLEPRRKPSPAVTEAGEGFNGPEIEPRTTSFLTHPAFTNYRTETAMMRYLRMLADKDLALDRTMIPLGSCTMKLNAAAEMESITWPEFGRLPRSRRRRTRPACAS